MKKRCVRAHAILRCSQAFARGTTLIELIVALFVFMIISSAAVMLVRRHVALYPTQQGQAELNIQLRTSISQMQTDLMNAGADYYPGADAPGSPVGITIQNQSGTDCYNSETGIYSASCFDSFTILTFDSKASAHPIATSDVSATSSMLITPNSITAPQLASLYKKNTELLLVTGAVSVDTGTPKFMTITLNADAIVSGGNVLIQWPSASDSKVTGVPNLKDGSISYTGYYNGSERYGIAANPVGCVPAVTTTSTFDTTARVLKLSAIAYRVSTDDVRNPQLVRTANGQDAVIANNIVGFKVGAMTWGKPQGASSEDDMPTYLYDPCSYYHKNDFSLIRSVKVSLIGRTANDPTSGFVNSFDAGHYRVEALSVVASPRNLSMHD